MAINWAQLRGQVRRLLIDTTSSKYRWSDEQLLDFIAWSLDDLCAHTAIATATGFVGDGTNKEFTLPDNVFDSFANTGLVFVDDGISVSYLNLVPLYKQNTALNGYYLSPENLIHTILTPSNNSAITVNYYAYYPHPSQDSDVILAPNWAIAALVFRMASYAHSSLASKTSQIRQWGQKPDTGNPDDNPLMDQSQYYEAMYERELYKYPRQERGNYARTDLVNGRIKSTL